MLFDGLHQNPSSGSSLQSGILIKIFISMTPIRCHLPWIFQIQTLPHGFPDGLLVVCSPSLPPSINAILLITFKFWLTRNDKVPFWSLSHMSNILLRLCNSFNWFSHNYPWPLWPGLKIKPEVSHTSADASVSVSSSLDPPPSGIFHFFHHRLLH